MCLSSASAHMMLLSSRGVMRSIMERPSHKKLTSQLKSGRACKQVRGRWLGSGVQH